MWCWTDWLVHQLPQEIVDALSGWVSSQERWLQDQLGVLPLLLVVVEERLWSTASVVLLAGGAEAPMCHHLSFLLEAGLVLGTSEVDDRGARALVR